MRKFIKLLLVVALIILVGCGEGIEQNISIDNNEITNNTKAGIFVSAGYRCCNVTNNNLSNNGNFSFEAAAALNDTPNETLILTILKSMHGGVIFFTLFNGLNPIIINNTINNNKGFGIFASGDLTSLNNNITNNFAGGIISGANAIIIGNNVSNNNLGGIFVLGKASIENNIIMNTTLGLVNSTAARQLSKYFLLFFTQGALTIENYSLNDGIAIISAKNVSVRNNSINFNHGFGISFLNGTNVNISENNITNNNLSGIGLFASNASVSYNNISDNGVNGTEFAPYLLINSSGTVSSIPLKPPSFLSVYNGISAYGAPETIIDISNNTINNNLENGILNINQTFENIINNTICYNGIAAITDLSSNSTIQNNEFCNASTILRKLWWVDFFARDDARNPLNGTNITTRDVNGTEWVNNLTEQSGHFVTALPEYYANNSDTLYFSNYSVNASKQGYTNTSKSFNLTHNVVINLTLELVGGAIWDLDPPTEPIVVDGYNYVDYDWTNSNTSLNASWFNSTDRNIIWYTYKVYENGTCIIPEDCSFAVDVGQLTQTTVSLNLTECSNYTFQVQARDTFWNRANWTSSDGIVVDTTPPTMDTLASSSHPDENASYINKNIVLEWNASDSGLCPSGIESYSYLLDNINDTIPDNVPETNATTVTFYDVEPATWYFHIKAKDFAGSWSNTLHFKINIVPSEVRIRLNPVESPTFFGSINITGNVNKNVSLLRLFVNSNNTQNLTDVFAGGFNFTDVSLELGMNIIYADAYINDTFVGTSNTLYIKRINETRFNVSELNIVKTGTCPGLFCGAATDSPLNNIFGGASIKSDVKGNAMIVITREDAPTEKRFALLQNKSFFEFINPSFGYPLDLKTVEVGILINYPNIVLIGNETVPPGRYTITIRHEGIDNTTGRPKVNVTIT